MHPDDTRPFARLDTGFGPDFILQKQPFRILQQFCQPPWKACLPSEPLKLAHHLVTLRFVYFTIPSRNLR